MDNRKNKFIQKRNSLNIITIIIINGVMVPKRTPSKFVIWEFYYIIGIMFRFSNIQVYVKILLNILMLPRQMISETVHFSMKLHKTSKIFSFFLILNSKRSEECISFPMMCVFLMRYFEVFNADINFTTHTHQILMTF